MKSPNELPLTAYYVQDPNDNGYTGFFAEFPGAVAEGDTQEEVENNLFKALNYMVSFNKEDAKSEINFINDGVVVEKTYSLKLAEA
jgi:predicted RNase H-like HicB family nuclease